MALMNEHLIALGSAQAGGAEACVCGIHHCSVQPGK